VIFDFVNQDISLVRNIEFQKVRGISDLFSTRLLEQLEADAEKVSLLSRLTNNVVTAFGHFQTAARFQSLLCSVRKDSLDANCNSRAVYLQMIEQSSP
jgi:hypothetical protein